MNLHLLYQALSKMVRLRPTPGAVPGLAGNDSTETTRAELISYVSFQPFLHFNRNWEASSCYLSDASISHANIEIVASHIRWSPWKCFHRVRREGCRSAVVSTRQVLVCLSFHPGFQQRCNTTQSHLLFSLLLPLFIYLYELFLGSYSFFLFVFVSCLFICFVSLFLLRFFYFS